MLTLWASIKKSTNALYWHVEHEGEPLLERLANLDTPDSYEAGVITGLILKMLHLKGMTECGVFFVA